MDKAIALKETISPEEYAQNAAQIEAAKVYLANLEAKNEAGKQKYQAELLRKIQEGEQARQLLANMASYSSAGSSRFPAIESGPSTSRIEEMPSNSPQPPQQQWKPSNQYSGQYANVPSQYHPPATVQIPPHPQAQTMYANPYTGSVVQPYPGTGAYRYGTPSTYQQANSGYNHPPQTTVPVHRPTPVHPPPPPQTTPRQYQQTQAPPPAPPAVTQPSSASQPAVPNGSASKPQRQSSRTSKATGKPSPPLQTARSNSGARKPPTQSVATVSSSSSARPPTPPEDKRRAVLQFKDAVYRWASETPASSAIDVHGVRVMKDENSILHILAMKNGSAVKQDPQEFFQDLLSKFDIPVSAQPHSSAPQPTTIQTQPMSAPVPQVTRAAVPNPPVAATPPPTTGHANGSAATPLVKPVEQVAQPSSTPKVPSASAQAPASQPPVPAAATSKPTLQPPAPPMESNVAPEAPLPVAAPATLIPPIVSLDVSPERPTTPPNDHSISIPITPGLPQRQRTLVNGTARSPQDANKTRLARDLLSALGKRKQPGHSTPTVENPAKRVALEMKEVDITSTKVKQSGQLPSRSTAVPSAVIPPVSNAPSASTSTGSSGLAPNQVVPPAIPQPSQVPATTTLQSTTAPAQAPPSSVWSQPVYQPVNQYIPAQTPSNGAITWAPPYVGPIRPTPHSASQPTPAVPMPAWRSIHANVTSPQFLQGTSTGGAAAGSSASIKTPVVTVASTAGEGKEVDKSAQVPVSQPPSAVTSADTAMKVVVDAVKKPSPPAEQTGKEVDKAAQVPVSLPALGSAIAMAAEKAVAAPAAEKAPEASKGVGNTASASGSVPLLEPVVRTSSKPIATPKPQLKTTPKADQPASKTPKTNPSEVVDLTSPAVANPPRAALASKATSDPLFLPSPPSSGAGPLPPSSNVSETSSSVCVLRKSAQSGVVPAAVAPKAKEQSNNNRKQLFYVLVPPAPKYLVEFREWEAKLEGKRSRREYERVEGRRSSSVAVSRPGSRASGAMDVDETEDIVSVYRKINEATVDPEEQKAIDLSCSRLRPTPCQWAECNVVLNSADALARHLVAQHKPAPIARKNQSFICRWKACGKQCPFQGKHLEKHASSPLWCAFQGCEESFRSVGKMMRHFQEQHGQSELKPTAVPFVGTPSTPSKPLPDEVVAANAFVTDAVRPTRIKPERHKAIGPWIIRHIMASDQDRMKKPKRTKKTARVTNQDPYPGIEPSNTYEFLTTTTVRYSSYRSEAVTMNTNDLDSAAISREFDQGLTLWAPEGDGTADLRGAGDISDEGRPLSPLLIEGVNPQGAFEAGENDEEVVEEMLIGTDSPIL